MSLTFSQFASYPNLKYGFSKRSDGSMNRQTEKVNRAEYFKKIGLEISRTVTADSVHGARVEVVGAEQGGKMVEARDGLLTKEKNLFLCATGADCFLIYFYDPINQAIGLTHVGWRGLLAGIIKNTIVEFALKFKSDPKNILVGVSPGIRSCHFEISPADKDKYKEYSNFVSETNGRVFVDLPGIIKFQLAEQGILEENSAASEICTYCAAAEYFSYRRDKPTEVQPMMGYIGLTV